MLLFFARLGDYVLFQAFSFRGAYIPGNESDVENIERQGGGGTCPGATLEGH